MKFERTLESGVLIKRYKRFLADIERESGEMITIHCPNTGSMLNCNTPASQVWFSHSDNPKRKYPHTWELVAVANGHLACINTLRANHLVKSALANNGIKELQGYGNIRSEVRYGQENSRIDLLLEDHPHRPECYVEIKSVTLGLEKGIGLFPDAVTTRGARHLRELMEMKACGKRAVLFFCVMHSGIREVRPADQIDPNYGQLLRQAMKNGVEVIAYGTKISPKELILNNSVSVHVK